MSHNLRTPLNIIIGYAEQLLEIPHLSSEQHQQLLKIRNAAYEIEQRLQRTPMADTRAE